jgi:hypothetical protein
VGEERGHEVAERGVTHPAVRPERGRPPVTNAGGLESN